MLTSLSITNFALIEKLDINFSNGFSIITGETGAGKSILLGALGLVLGKRADLSSLKNKEEKCVVEACFQISNYNLQTFFEENDLDYEAETIIRREILASGKSRAFINDSPVNLQELQELGSILIDVHSQHQTQELSEENFQFQIIDAVANTKNDLSSYSDALRQYKKNKIHLNTLKSELQSVQKEQEYTTFLLEELVVANLKLGEQDELESDYKKLNNVEFIRENIDKSLLLANEEQFGILQNLKEIKLSLQKTANFSVEFQTIFDRISSVTIEFDDIVKEISQVSENLNSDPEQLELINQKLQTIYNLQKKHQVVSIEELLTIQNDLDSKVISVVSLDIEIKKLENSQSELTSKLDVIAAIIYKKRTEAVPILSEKWTNILVQLGMPNVRFNILIKPTSNYFEQGKDELQFLFSANKGTDFGLLKKVASGGELSRIMLATKAILATYSKLPTIIFDEIDTGVSGEVANQMGNIMKNMSANMQVFAITHLPQIAAKGNTHFKVLKSIIGEQTFSEVLELSNEERIIEIAQMLSGSNLSDSAINHAKSLLN
jgi:DNA repair protein RecN (Recombination protein N)